MFRGATNPYEEIVVKATDENQTSENWEIILNLCDKVAEEGEQGARNVTAAVLKRLTHRNANVQIYSLAVAEALSKNCGIEVHREIASRAFTQGLEKLVTDRTGHDKVKKKALSLIDGWEKEWANDPSLNIMHELHENLKGKGFRFELPVEPPPPDVDVIRRREEEELQRVLELSMQDKGGRSWGGGYAPSPSAGSSSTKDYGSTQAAADQEPLPEPTSADLAREAEAEASVFAQSVNIDKLLTLLRNFDINKNNLADDENIQELYRSSMGVRPKIIRLIEKYNQKKVELAMMNDNFVSAKELFDRMMEESLAKHNPNAYPFRREPSARPPGWGGQYPQQQPPPQPGFYPQYGPLPQEPAQATYPPQLYPPQQQIDPALYAAQQAYAGQDPNAYQAQQFPQQPVQQPQGYDPNAYAAQLQAQQAQQAQASLQGQQPQVYDPAQYGAQANASQPAITQPAPAASYNQNAFGSPPYQQPSQTPYDPNANTNVPNAGAQQSLPQATQQPAYDPNSYASQYGGQPSQPAGQPSATGAPPNTEQQPAGQPQDPVQQQQQQQQQQQIQPAPGSQPTTGGTPKVYTGAPPYPFDPTGQYPDANAQAWVQYYAAGGDDPQGAVYFHSVPGVKEAAPATSPPASNTELHYGTTTQTAQQAQQSQSSVAPSQAQQQQQQQQQQQPQGTDVYSTQQLSPKSPVGQLKASPKSNRLSMAGVGTIAQHPHLQNTLPNYAHEHLHGNRPSSAGASGVPASSWPHQHQATAAGPTSPGGSSPWNPQNPQIYEPTRTDSASPSGGYRPYYGGISQGGPFVPASAGPQSHSNQPTPYPTHPSPRSQQQQLVKGAP
ncbi:ESCRT-0 subunit protein hse1 [Serendipita sp. 396]|nr:ESCRT-0 subunit protein hse1 [Serendipita sp. 396]